MYHFTENLLQRLRRKILYKSLLQQGCSIGPDTHIHHTCGFECPANISLGPANRILRGAILIAPPTNRFDRKHTLVTGPRVYIGHQSYIDAHGGFIDLGADVGLGPFCALYAHGGITFGEKVIVGARASFIAGQHVFDDPRIPIADQGENWKGITVHDDVWIGAHALILDGVTIGRHSVVAGGSVVTRDVPPFTLVAGVPAAPVRSIGPDATTP